MKLLFVLLLLPVTVFGALTCTDRGTGTDNTSTASMSASPSGTVAAGSTLVWCIAIDNASASNFPNSTTDSVGNTYYRRLNVTGGSAGANVEMVIYSGRMISSLGTGGSVSVTFSTANVTAKTWTLTEVVPAAGRLAMYKFSGSVSGNGTTALVNTGTVSNGDAVLAMTGVENGAPSIVGDSDTSNGSWSTAQAIAVGTGATGMAISTQSKVVNASGSGQQYNTSFSTNDHREGYVILGETDIKARAASGVGTSEATTNISFALPLTSGNLGVMAIAADNSGTSGTTTNLPATLTDTPAGNTWTRRQTNIFNLTGANSGVELGIYTSVLTANITPGVDTITCTYLSAAVLSKTWVVWEFAPSGAGPMSYVTGAMPSGSNTASPTITSGTIALNDYIIGVAGSEWADTWSPDAGMSPQVNESISTLTSGMSITSQWKQVSPAATVTYAPTQTVADTLIGWIEINDATPIGPTAAQKAAFFLLFP